MRTAQSRVAVADITATLVTDFDLPSILQLIADYALAGCEASSAAIVVLDEQGLLCVAAHAGTPTDPVLDTSGPAQDSARNSVTAMVDNWNTSGQRWERHRAVALANGFIGLRAFRGESRRRPSSPHHLGLGTRRHQNRTRASDSGRPATEPAGTRRGSRAQPAARIGTPATLRLLSNPLGEPLD